MRIWKYPLEVKHRQEITMPAGAQPLTVGVQGYGLCLWALVDPERPQVVRAIGLRGTGAICDPEENVASYIGTVQMGPFVWHLFDLGER